MHPEHRDRRGFILATTLLVMTLLTVMLTAGFVMVSAEYRSTNGSFSAARGLNLAQAGLNSYFADTHALGTGYDSTSYTFPGGYARVVARQLRDSTPTERPLWIVYSTGVDTSRTLSNSAGGSRTVSSLAYQPGQIPARAGMTALSGVTLSSSGTNPLYGTNSQIGATWVVGCVTPPSPDDDTTGLSTITGGYGAGGSGGGPDGGIEYVSTATALYDSTTIDWARVLAGDFYPDYTGTLPSDCFGTSAVCPYRSYFIDGNVTITASSGSSSRRGLLIVTGDVTMNSRAHWDGIIIAGGRLLATGSATFTFAVHGMVISGLNCGTGSCPGASQVRRGLPAMSPGSPGGIRWDWCYANAALSGFASLAPLASTYSDLWRTY